MQNTPSKRYQQLQPEDRLMLARLAQQKHSVRAMAQMLGLPPRAPSANRELRRPNIRHTGYASTTASACLSPMAASAGSLTGQTPS